MVEDEAQARLYPRPEVRRTSTDRIPTEACRSRLHSELLFAHRSQNGERLTELYTEAAKLEASCGNIDAECFFLTQAYVQALQCDHPTHDQLRARLVKLGRL